MNQAIQAPVAETREERSFRWEVEGLSIEFALRVSHYLMPEQLVEVNQRNAAPGRHPDACATHDFCDANMLMLAALESCDYEFKPDCEVQVTMCNRAWRAAKAAGFDGDKLMSQYWHSK